MPRYIETEKLLDQFLELCGGESCLDCQFFGHGCNLERMILNQPIADVQPVRHGHWIVINENLAKCSVCGALESTNGIDRTGKGLIFKAIKKYCSNCGARMDSLDIQTDESRLDECKECSLWEKCGGSMKKWTSFLKVGENPPDKCKFLREEE